MRPLVHIGYHKTATSWLQDNCFADSESGFATFERDRLPRLVVEPPPLAWDARACRKEIGDYVAATITGGRVPVLSHERLSGYPHSGGYDSVEIARRLAQVLPEASVLVVIREQRAMIQSNYYQYVRDGGASPLARYLEPPQEGHRRVPGFSFDYFRYHPLVEVYADLFGEQNVLVLPYEWFREEPSAFVAAILRFARPGAATGDVAKRLRLEQVANPSLSAFAATLMRWSNLWFRANPLHPAPPLPIRGVHRALFRILRDLDRAAPASLAKRFERRHRRLIERHCHGRYAESNRILGERLGVDLRRYGYDCDAADSVAARRAPAA